MFFAYSVYYSYTHKIKDTYLDCGVIRSKSGEEIAIKHGVKTILLLNIDFNKTGFKSIEVDYTTYFKYLKGQNICFNLEKKQTIIHTIFFVVSYIVHIVVVYSLIYYLLRYIL